MKISLTLLTGLLVLTVLGAVSPAATAFPNMVNSWTATVQGIHTDGTMENDTGTVDVLGQSGSLFYGTITSHSNGKIQKFTGYVSASGAVSITISSSTSVQTTFDSSFAHVPGTCSVTVGGQKVSGTTSTDLQGLTVDGQDTDAYTVCNGSVSGKTLSCVVNSPSGYTFVLTATHP